MGIELLNKAIGWYLHSYSHHKQYKGAISLPSIMTYSTKSPPLSTRRGGQAEGAEIRRRLSHKSLKLMRPENNPRQTTRNPVWRRPRQKVGQIETQIPLTTFKPRRDKLPRRTKRTRGQRVVHQHHPWPRRLGVFPVPSPGPLRKPVHPSAWFARSLRGK